MENSSSPEPENPSLHPSQDAPFANQAAPVESTHSEPEPSYSAHPSEPPPSSPSDLPLQTEHTHVELSSEQLPLFEGSQASPESQHEGPASELPQPTPQDAMPSSLEDGPAIDAPTSPLSEPEAGSLEAFAAHSLKGRLNLEEESEAAALLRVMLLGGRAEVARAVKIIPTLPWIVTVQGTAAAWPEMKPSFRTQLLAGLAKTDGEPAARVRLSLARGLFKIDPAASMKLILLTLKVLRDKQTGLLAGKGAPLFANVLIGRGKAWALQLPTEGLKPAELDLLVNSALHGAFHAPHAPITQLSILRWAAHLGKLNALPAALDQLIAKALSRWSGKWQFTLRKEIQDLPSSWGEHLKHLSHPPRESSRRGYAPSHAPDHEDEPPQGHEDSSDQEPNASDDSSEPAPEASDAQAEPQGESSEENQKEEDRDEDEDEKDLDEEDEEDEEDQDEEDDRSGRESSGRRPRPVYVSKTVPAQGQLPPSQQGRRSGLPSHFNLSETLRQIDLYAQGLRQELQSAQKQLRHRDEDHRRSRRPERPLPPLIPGEPSVEELSRLNLQLESRNAELTARIQELTLDSEDRATSQGLITDVPVTDTNAQLRSLLAFKLQEDFEDFQALEQATKDLVVQQHYRTVLQHVFQVLQQEGVCFPPPEKTP